MRNKRRQRMRWILAAYLFLLIVLVIFKFNGSFSDLADRAAQVQANRADGYMNFNLKLFTTIRLYLRQLPQAYAWKNLIANILAFFPLGFLLPQAYRFCRKLPAAMVVSFVFLLGCEALQLVTLLGSFDVDDILLNMIGVLTGFICWRILWLKSREARRRLKAEQRRLAAEKKAEEERNHRSHEQRSEEEDVSDPFGEEDIPVSRVS